MSGFRPAAAPAPVRDIPATAVEAKHAIETPVQIGYTSAAGALMQAIDILGDDTVVTRRVLQLHQSAVRGCGPRFSTAGQPSAERPQ
jgi:hypothetical protein